MNLPWRKGLTYCQAADDCYQTAQSYSFRADLILAAQVAARLREEQNDCIVYSE